MDDVKRIKKIIEALLIVAEEGLSRQEIVETLDDVDIRDIDESIRLLKDEYADENRAFMLIEIAGKCRIVTKPEYMPWISNLYKPPADRLSGPSLETLAIIAYKQSVTRAEIESIRGVNVGGVLKTLLEKGLILVKGRKDIIGKPLLYGTTSRFLELFGLNSLEDLPRLRDFTEEELEYDPQGRSQVLEIEVEGDKDPPGDHGQGAGGTAAQELVTHEGENHEEEKT